MCGIAGFIGGGTMQTAEAMHGALKHRGPDAGRSVLYGKVGLSHRRLAILDLSEAGTQPMISQNGRYTIVYNGEVFNYRELQEVHLHKHHLRSSSDTEVIIELFAKLGTDAFSLLEGMYAFAIYDQHEEVLYLHRDRLGKKPLYYSCVADGSFVFASELKALHEHPSFISEIDPVAINQYLLYEYIPTPRTIYKNVYKLEPGQVLTVRGGCMSFSTLPILPVRKDFDDDPVKYLDKLLASAVERRLVADVPVGIFLSGGLDSSLVAAFAQEKSAQPIKSFSIGFEDQSFNEQASARRVAEHLGTDHYEATLRTADIVRLLPSLPLVLDEPMADSSIIPTVLVSEHARQKVTVCLSGDGADELFLGYGTFLAHRLAARFDVVPAVMRKSIEGLVRGLPVSHSYMSLDFKLKRFLLGSIAEPSQRNSIWLSACTPEMVRAVREGHVSDEQLWEPLSRWHTPAASQWDNLKSEYVKGYLLDDILVKADRASMSQSLEVRSPFLDERVVTFAAGLDDSWKLHRTTSKYILRKVAESRLPKDIVYRKKQGFNFPVGSLIKGELRAEFTSVLLEGGLQKINLFKRDKIEELLNEHVTGKADHRKALWSLYVLGKWMDHWV